MKNYKKYAKEANEVIKSAFNEIQKAERAHLDAKTRQEAFKHKRFDNELDARMYQAQAEADYIRTQKELKELKARVLSDTQEKLQGVRKALQAQISKDTALKPDKMDTSTITLLESGVLKATDYKELLDNAISEDNATMIKLIAKYAEKRVHDTALDPHERQTYLAVSSEASMNTGDAVIDNFDTFGAIFERSVNNTRLIDSWDTLTAPIIDTF